jgi:hypothetical protein
LDKKFTSDEIPLAQILEQARTGQLQLPDFQRGWVWDDDHIVSLLASISLSYPIGAVMTLQTGNPDVRFKPRACEGVELDGEIEPELLLLDGQQRITSLYLALKSPKAVPTRDAKGKRLLRHYYADIARCLNPADDREEAIRSVPEDRTVRNFRGEVLLDLSDREAELGQGMFPLEIVLDYAETMSWQLAYLENGPGAADERLEAWKAFNELVINAFVQYQVPTIQLVKSTPKEAVCQVFEKVNTGGVSLTVFELLTATFAVDDFNLRDDWDTRKAQLEEHDVLTRVQATDFLQIVTLLATQARRHQYLEHNPTDEKAPAVSCKRRDVLRLTVEEYREWAGVALDALLRIVSFLHTEHVFAPRDIPYTTQLVPLAAIYADLGSEAEGHANREKLARWYWCGVFGEMYGGATETRFALDLPDVAAWVRDGADEPRTIRDAQFQADRLLTLRTRNSAAYKGLYALQMKRGARDFRTGKTIDVHAYVDDAIDIHHVFPRRWCSSEGVDEGFANSVVNKTAVDAHTNRRIGGNAPSKYLKTIESQEGIDPADLDAILRSHDIDPMTLRQNDFAGFFNERFERLLKQIEAATGKSVNRSGDEGTSPFQDPSAEPADTRESIEALIHGGESKVVEFKSTGRRNRHTGEKDTKVEWAVLRALAGFMNAHGGTLLVGVDDEGQVVGIEEDFSLLKKPNHDAWGLWLTDAAAGALGKSAASELELRFGDLDGGSVARIDVGPAPAPVFAQPASHDGPVFYVRINNTTHELAGQEALDYQKKRWPE